MLNLHWVKISLSVALAAFASTLSFAHTSIAEFGTAGDDSARLATFDSAAGEISFALSLKPQLDNNRQLASDTVIFIDTSASQTGMYRRDSIVALRRLLVHLNAEDRVKLYAVDIEPVGLTDRFVAPNSDEIKAALDKLRQRVPLGSTDMQGILRQTKSLFGPATPDRNRNAIYIGDGVSRGQFTRSANFSRLISGLVSEQIAFSSYAIGPERDIEALSAIANQTGGNIFIDTDDKRSVTVAAKGLAKTVHAMVFWPGEMELPANVVEAYPAKLPPLRADRDSIVIGTLKERGGFEFNVSGKLAGQQKSMNWPLTVEATNADFAFLPKLIQNARKDDGMTLPTVGSNGLREMARVMEVNSTRLTALSTHALGRGDYSSAKTLSEAALGNDPNSPEAAAILKKTNQDDDDPFGDGGGDDADDDPFGDGGGDQDDGDPFGDGGQESDDDPFGDDSGGDADDDPFGDGGGDQPMPDDGGQDPSGDDPFGDGGGDQGGDNPFGDDSGDDPFGDGGGDQPMPDDAGAQDPAGDEPAGDDPFGDGGDDPFGDGGAQDPPAEEPPAEDPFGDDGAVDEPVQDAPADEDPFGQPEPAAEDPSEELPQPTDPADEVQPSELPEDRPSLPNQLQPGQTPTEPSDSGAIRMVNPEPAQPQGYNDLDEFLRRSATGSQELILSEQERERVMTQRLKTRIRVELERARDEIANGAPGKAVERLKSMLEVLDQVTIIDEGVLGDLRSRVLAGLHGARREKLQYDEALARAGDNAAIAGELEDARIAYVDRETRLAALINSFDHLLREREYAAAEAVTKEAVLLAPDRPAAQLAFESSRMISNLQRNLELRQLRQTAFLDTLYQAELSSMAFPADPPLVFPDAAVWHAKKRRRAKYEDVRLAGNASDEAILQALDEPADMDYEDITFGEVMDDLREESGINVRLDQSARDDSLTEDDLITFNVKGIRLKNALRLMLKDKNATFIVQDEVLKIISLDVASDPEFFVRNVYNVGDLVAPRIPVGGGGIGGGLGGGGLGGGGLGGGGGGLGGGGFGGGAGGLGGGGGVFCVVDSLDDEEPDPTRKLTRIATPSGASPLDAWSGYFAENHPDPARVRETVRALKAERETDQITGLILGAIQNNQSQPWMYQALVLALQIGNKPEAEIARALTSAVDLSSDKNDVLIAAKYLVDAGLEKRAINLLKQVCDYETNSPEAFVLGLNAAQKIDDVEGIKWATLGILNQAWPSHRQVVKRAINAAAGLKMDLKKQGLIEEHNQFARQLDESLYRDCLIKVSWTGDADVDLFVEEPGGTICSRRNQRTTAGGIMMGDAWSASPDQSGELAEYYVLPRGFSGDYRLMVRKVWGDVTANKVTVAIYHHYRTDKQSSEQRQINLGDNGSLVLFNLADGRRTQSLEQHAIETATEQEFFASRSLLAQQFRDGRSSSAASDYYSSRGEGGSYEGTVFSTDDNELDDFVSIPRGVGYRPEITQLFEGAFMTASATTADRLYVLVNVAPTFNQITDVNTFNALGNASTAGGAGGALGGGAGGIGAGGGGIGGGLF